MTREILTWLSSLPLATPNIPEMSAVSGPSMFAKPPNRMYSKESPLRRLEREKDMEPSVKRRCSSALRSALWHFHGARSTSKKNGSFVAPEEGRGDRPPQFRSRGPLWIESALRQDGHDAGVARIRCIANGHRRHRRERTDARTKRELHLLSNVVRRCTGRHQTSPITRGKTNCVRWDLSRIRILWCREKSRS